MKLDDPAFQVYKDIVDQFLALAPTATRQQRNFLQQLARELVESDMLGKTDKYELKSVTIAKLGESKTCAKILVIHTTCGLKNDDGTMASIFAQDNHHIFLGPQGGAYAYNKKNKKVYGPAALYTKCGY